jgi:hypothetical protein
VARWRPKSWVTPKTPHRGEVLHVHEVLKETWPQHDLGGGPIWERPWYAKLARDRRWISWGEYFEYETEDTGRVAPGFFGIYEDNPFFAMLKKDTDWESSSKEPT